MTGPLVSLAFRQWGRLRRQAELIAQQEAALAERDAQVGRLQARIVRLHADVELVAACIHPARRADVLALVRDRHRIESGNIIEEAG